ncbi:MAG: NAD(P)/FAD-dependent oxidoreductase [Nitrospiraceae bacterium]|nr:NAD(P)/FAD-dependent oxidoreductase [Nitrospiraceae bacterium]
MARGLSSVAVIGAGPYGLAITAHLRAAGIETRTFGRAMEAWQRHMPRGMLLRTAWATNHIADPEHRLSLDRFWAGRQLERADPLPLAEFIQYGQWYQQQAVPDLDERRVTRIEPNGAGFWVRLNDGDSLHVSRIVVATGYCFFARRPPEFDAVPRDLASHTFEEPDLTRFAGRRVAIIGGGQSGFGSAALLQEAGAAVEMIVRQPTLSWIAEASGEEPVGWAKSLYRSVLPHLGRARGLLLPKHGVGPPPFSWITARPGLVRRLPSSWRHWINRWIDHRIIDRGSSWWPSRVRRVPMTLGRSVVSAVPEGGGLTITLNDGTVRRVDHALLATGYAVDVRRYPFFAPELVAAIHHNTGYPVLGPGFESSVKGLHFVGLAGQGTFGPMMNSIAGTQYAARAVTKFCVRHLTHCN